MLAFSQKAPDEIWIVGIDFSPQLASGATIASCAVTIATALGSTDPNPSAVLSGSASLSGTVVSQLVHAGLSGQTYILFFDATCSNGEVLEAQASLSVATVKN